MTLGNMRANGVRSLLVYCLACHRDVVFDVEMARCDRPARRSATIRAMTASRAGVKKSVARGTAVGVT
jgi:hypothetical protein